MLPETIGGSGGVPHERIWQGFRIIQNMLCASLSSSWTIGCNSDSCADTTLDAIVGQILSWGTPVFSFGALR